MAMFSTMIDKILCFMGPPHKMKMSNYFSVFDPIRNLGLFNLQGAPLILNFWIFLSPPPPSGPGRKIPRFFVWKASLT